MSSQVVRDLKFFCCLFCCPPCPTQISAKIAFWPPEPTYTLEAGESNNAYTLCMSPNVKPGFDPRELKRVEIFYTTTSRGNRIACLFVKCSPSTKKTLLYSHGNAVDLGYMCDVYLALGSWLNCNVFGYDYSGYGQSEGHASEKNLYADIDAAFNALQNRCGIARENIILYGQSIGTVATVHLAAKHEVAGVVLQSPLMSGMRVVFPSTKRTWFFDTFVSIERVSKITSPVLVIHGTNDQVIDFSHGQAIYERCPRAVEPLWVEGAGHSDIESYDQYVDRLERFVSLELAN